MHPLKIFVIAGEESGDLLGGAILRSIARLSPRTLTIMGIGGDSLKSAGLKTSLFPMRELSVMGLVEILPRIPKFLGLIQKTVEAIEAFKPDLVLTIDSPDFCFRVQKKLRARGNGRARQIHVVAPSVWAWRPGRAKKITAFLDGLVCFFPFEPPYFTAHGLPAIDMGHPAINAPIAWVDGAPLRRVLDLRDETPVLGLYLGSRAGVIDRHAPIFIQALNQLAETTPHLCVLIPTFPAHADRIKACTQNLILRHHVITDPLLKPVAMRACNVALAVSGTVGLELAIAGVPHVVGYKFSALSWLIGKTLVKRGQFAHLANIVMDRAVVPEYIQSECRAQNLVTGVNRLLSDPAARTDQMASFSHVRKAIGEGAPVKPADKAAEFILARL